jgi:hypothetical protein
MLATGYFVLLIAAFLAVLVLSAAFVVRLIRAR